jgi:3-hydroxyisobutyrate dehydrogenase-like beta-hydroxyacid dehydrogenase
MLSSAGTVGFIGLGKMGFNMVQAVLACCNALQTRARDHRFVLCN